MEIVALLFKVAFSLVSSVCFLEALERARIARKIHDPSTSIQHSALSVAWILIATFLLAIVRSF